MIRPTFSNQSFHIKMSQHAFVLRVYDGMDFILFEEQYMLRKKKPFEGQRFYRFLTRNENNHVYHTMNIDKFLNISAKNKNQPIAHSIRVCK